jgi:hypothetical protein
MTFPWSQSMRHRVKMEPSSWGCDCKHNSLLGSNCGNASKEAMGQDEHDYAIY